MKKVERIKRKYKGLTMCCRIGLLVALFALFVGLPVYAATTANVTIVGTPQMIYELNISPVVGGYTSLPGEGVFTYNISDEVHIKAVHNAHYRFVGWAGETEKIADVNLSSTTITMVKDWDIYPQFVYDASVLPPEAEARGQLTGTLLSLIVAGGGGLSLVAVSMRLIMAGRGTEAFSITIMGIVTIGIIEAIVVAIFMSP